MKLLTIAVPCYNSQDYMDKCIQSLLPGGEDVEILIIDDGSTDRTAAIADSYAARYPSIVRAIHQPNGGHGEAVNTGIRNAAGLYFKVVDSDDWLGKSSYQKVLRTLEELTRGPQTVDMFIANFVYDKQGADHKRVMNYRHCIPVGRVFGWNDVRHMPTGKYLLMHSMIYRTQLLVECGLSLPAHTFYVDNLFAFEPLPYVKTMCYIDTNLYHYFIGRDDQSVNEKVMISRIDQQIKVNKLMVDVYCRQRFLNKNCRRYMITYLDVITSVSSMMLIRKGTPGALQQKKELLAYIRTKNLSLYHVLRHSLLGTVVNLPGRGGRTVTVVAYKIMQKIYGFN